MLKIHEHKYHGSHFRRKITVGVKVRRIKGAPKAARTKANVEECAFFLTLQRHFILRLKAAHLFVFCSFQRFTGKLHILGHERHKGSVTGSEIHELYEINPTMTNVLMCRKKETFSTVNEVRIYFYLLLNCIRGALYLPLLQRRFVLGVDHRSKCH